MKILRYDHELCMFQFTLTKALYTNVWLTSIVCTVL
jgi:hypothetical protein